MSAHFQRDLERLLKKLVEIAGLVETNLARAVRALIDGEHALAEEVIAGDALIDEKEIDVEAECLKILALHQPVAHDLRFLIAVLKVDNDLERIGDLSRNIASRVDDVASSGPAAFPEEVAEMARRAKAMVRKALDALLAQDVEGAREVLVADDAVDELHRGLVATATSRMRSDPDHVPQALALLSASHDLERIADLATNIAEDVIFLVEAHVVRHGLDRGFDRRRRAPSSGPEARTPS